MQTDKRFESHDVDHPGEFLINIIKLVKEGTISLELMQQTKKTAERIANQKCEGGEGSDDDENSNLYYDVRIYGV